MCLDVSAPRSCHAFLSVASMAYLMLDSLRRVALQATDLADASCGTIRRKLFKIGALVSVRCIKFAMAFGCPLTNKPATMGT
jgi:Transposase DDE domain group 1